MPLSIPKLILASRSPRRRELLTAAGYTFEVFEPSASAESGDYDGETPVELVVRLARQKAADVVARLPTPPATAVVLGCDTVAECNGQILGKPGNREDARRMLETLSGRVHRVLSGLCLWPISSHRPMARAAATTLQMDMLGPRQLEEYLDSGLWVGKAGAFGYQDGIDWVRVLAGSESNVVGLPMELLAEMLAALRGPPEDGAARAH